jgi:hypothetical protein
MSVKKRFLLRIDQRLYDAMEKWASDDLRSVNAQIEFLLGEALKRSGRYPRPPKAGPGSGQTGGPE